MNEVHNTNELEVLKKELEQTQLAYQMAIQMSQFKAGFLARTSHELRSPLSSLIGLHQLILSDLCESPEEQKEFIAQAYNSAMKLMDLIDEIVAVSKTEYGSNHLDMESIQLSEIFAEIYNLTHLQAANRNLRLQINPPDYSIFVHTDRVRLIQSITNLIDCGITMMKEGTIKLMAIADSPETEINLEISFQGPNQLWQQEAKTKKIEISNDLEGAKELAQSINLSPEMRLLLSQTLIETMGGSLTLSQLPIEKQSITKITLSCHKSES